MTLPDPEASRAVLIGTSNYGPGSGFESFPEIARSLHDFAEFLRTATGIPERHIDVVLDPADGASVAATITAAARAARGLLLVYYVGHGTVVDNELHLTHSGSRVDEADVTALAYSVIRSRIKRDARGAVVVILDCCHSGKAFGRGVLAPGREALGEATDIDGAFVLTATDEKSKFAVATGAGGRTAFTGMLLDILRSGVPTDDRYLTMSMLYRELRERLPAADRPKPKALERGTAGRVALAENPGRRDRIAPAGLPSAVVTAYTTQIRDLSPADGLLDRAAELAELAEFCTGETPYVWWQAGPWAGKTALMSWFALHPPPSVRVVSFFITSRLAAQDDHHAFTDAVLEQLSALLPDQAAAVAMATGNRDALRRRPARPGRTARSRERRPDRPAGRRARRGPRQTQHRLTAAQESRPGAAGDRLRPPESRTATGCSRQPSAASLPTPRGRPLRGGLRHHPGRAPGTGRHPRPVGRRSGDPRTDHRGPRPHRDRTRGSDRPAAVPDPAHSLRCHRTHLPVLLQQIRRRPDQPARARDPAGGGGERAGPGAAGGVSKPHPRLGRPLSRAGLAELDAHLPADPLLLDAALGAAMWRA